MNVPSRVRSTTLVPLVNERFLILTPFVLLVATIFGLVSYKELVFLNNSTSETFTVRLTHNGSSGVFYTMGTQQITIHYTEAPLPDPFTLMSGKLELTSGKLELI